VQAGGGVLQCALYAEFNKEADAAPAMKTAMYMQVQVVSVACAEDMRVVGDAGFKSGFPLFGLVPVVVSHPCLKVKVCTVYCCTRARASSPWPLPYCLP
jgi:hypothetical protein